MKILIIGGTKFLGRALVQAALDRGHEITIFNRGKTNPALFLQVERIIGNRDGDLNALAGRTWDAVLDTCGYVPRVVKASVEYLADKTDHYTFISSVSVYVQDNVVNKDESGVVGTLENETLEEITGETYGPLKVLCEKTAMGAMPGRTLIIRPGLIVGPYDPTNRFTYWPVRIQRGGEILAPGKTDTPIQFIDVRDLAEWNIRMIEQKQTGIYNATGPDYRLTMGQLLDTCVTVTKGEVSLNWIDEAFLLEKQVGPWMEMPLWIPGEANESFHTIQVQKAMASGLRFRSLLDTIAATLDWVASGDEVPQNPSAGMKPDREAELLAAWYAK